MATLPLWEHDDARCLTAPATTRRAGARRVITQVAPCELPRVVHDPSCAVAAPP